MGCPTPSVAHHLSNPFGEDLTYLMGGETKTVEIADFPDIGKRMLRNGSDIEIYERAIAIEKADPERGGWRGELSRMGWPFR